MDKSIWYLDLNKDEYKSLQEDINVDVLVIGGGISGILAAKKLQDNGFKTVVVDKSRIGMGNTSKTTAFLTVQHETLYQDLSFDKRSEYLKLNNDAFKEYEELSKKYNFDFEYTDSCLFSEDENKIRKEYEVLKRMDQDVDIIDNVPLFELNKGIKFKRQAVINPIKFLNEMAKGLTIYEHTDIVELNDNIAIVDNGNKISFKYCVIATHYPINNKANLLFMKLTQRRSYVVAVKHEDIDGTYCSIDNDGMYFRMYKDYLIIGGNDRETGSKCIKDFEESVCTKLNINKDVIEFSWSGQDCITIDGIPYIGYSDVFHKNHIIITGFNFWGFTWAMASSNIVLDIIKNHKPCKLTKPNRFFIKKRLFKNLKTSFVNLLRIKKPRCSHLGCVLTYNKKEHAWECPCHGSRFNEEKQVTNGPAQTGFK